jgi:hypothetical protein
MFDLRTVALGVAVFGATFGVGWWLGVGKLASATNVPPAATVGAVPAGAPPAAVTPAPELPELQPKLRAFQQPAEPPKKVAALPAKGPGITDSDRLRKVLVFSAKAYMNPSCEGDARAIYVRAATNYAEALMRSAGCNNFPKCPMGFSQLDRVWQANRNALDQPVAEAMAMVHKAGGLTDRNFRGDVGRAVRVIAGVDFADKPGPSCTSSRNRGYNVRIRRR